MADGESVRFDAFAGTVFAPDAPDYAEFTMGEENRDFLIQERLLPHPEVEQFCGRRISTLRVIVMITENGPLVFRSTWKLAVGRNMADNYWRPGNAMAALHPVSGRILRVITGKGKSLRELEQHSDTRINLIGRTVPLWEPAKMLCLQAAQAFPEVGMQVWDIAICEEGPVLLEMNIIGSFVLPQLADNKGIMDDTFRDFLDWNLSTGQL